jgi:hypothetical protein
MLEYVNQSSWKGFEIAFLFDDEKRTVISFVEATSFVLGNNIGSEGIQILGVIFHSCPKLCTLDLSGLSRVLLLLSWL